MSVAVDAGYPAIYYQTIRDTGIDPVVCGPFGSGLVGIGIGPEGAEESGSATRPAQLAAKALAKATGAPARAPRKRAPRKATGAAAKKAAEPVKVAEGPAIGVATVPKQAAVKKTARGTAKVASSS